MLQFSKFGKLSDFGTDAKTRKYRSYGHKSVFIADENWKKSKWTLIWTRNTVRPQIIITALDFYLQQSKVIIRCERAAGIHVESCGISPNFSHRDAPIKKIICRLSSGHMAGCIFVKSAKMVNLWQSCKFFPSCRCRHCCGGAAVGRSALKVETCPSWNLPGGVSIIARHRPRRLAS